MPSGFYQCYDSHEANELWLGGGYFNVIHQNVNNYLGNNGPITQIIVPYTSMQLFSFDTINRNGKLFYRTRINSVWSNWNSFSDNKLHGLSEIEINPDGPGFGGFKFNLGDNSHYLTVEADGKLYYNGSLILNESNLNLSKSSSVTYGVIKTSYDEASQTLTIKTVD